ncbi:MAG: peptidase M50 [Thioploca sp.]|nr:peptidase M50 [Thioploca sp.]
MALLDYAWNKIAPLKLRLSSYLQIDRHIYRGQLWYALYDKASGYCHRFTPDVYQVVCLLNGKHTVQQIWERLQEKKLNYSKEEILQTLSQLKTNELLHVNAIPEVAVLEERRHNWQRLWIRQRYGSPLSIRIALWDPDKFLERWLPYLKWIFSWTSFIIWLSLVLWGMVLAAQHWNILTHDITDQVLAPHNLIILLLVFPFIKLLHELGHAFATKYWGGEVHELGILFLVFMPLPYVEASSASAFSNKYARLLVSAAGIIVELFIAAIAMLLWVNLEPSTLRASAYNVLFISSVSTLLFNGNPLLRYDGYYLFSDAIEIPNLGPRANRYIGYLFRHYLLGTRELPPPTTSFSEISWLVSYGIAAFCYRLFISVAIILFVASKFFIIGIVLAIWVGYRFFLLSLFKQIQAIFTNPILQQHQPRLILVLVTLTALLALGLFEVPVPLWSNVEGIIWPPERSQVRVGNTGFCRQILVQSGDWVVAEQPLIKLEDELLETRVNILQYQLDELEIRYNALWRDDYASARMLQEKIKTITTDLARRQQQQEHLVVRSLQAGQVYIPRQDRLLGRLLPQGELVAYVVKPPVNIIMAVVRQEDIALVRHNTERIEVRLAEQLQSVYPAVIERIIPAASHHLPSRALGKAGGGSIPIDPANLEGTQAYETIFQVEVSLVNKVAVTGMGERAYLRFYHGKEALAFRWYRNIRRLFLRRFDI